MALIKKTIELDQDQLTRIKLALNVKSEKEAINRVLSQFDTEIQLAEVTLKEAGTFEFDEVWDVQEKVIFDTNVYIGIFNRDRYRDEINWMNKITYLVHPVLHELWIGAKGKAEVQHLLRFGNAFIKLGRLVQPTSSTQMLIGQVCQRLRVAGHLDPKQPRHYNDVCIAILARQIGATVVTTDREDFQRIHNVIDFRFRHVLEG